MKTFKMRDGRQVEFSRDSVTLRSFCCQGCGHVYIGQRTKSAVRSALKNRITENDPVRLGCQSFGARTKAVAYAKRWVRR